MTVIEKVLPISSSDMRVLLLQIPEQKNKYHDKEEFKEKLQREPTNCQTEMISGDVNFAKALATVLSVNVNEMTEIISGNDG